MKLFPLTTAAAVGACLLASCSKEAASEDKSAAHVHEHGPHGGHIIEVGAHVAHLELVHDKDAGAMRLYVYGPDAETPLPLATAPQLKLTTADGPKLLATATPDGNSSGSVFTVIDEVLKGEPPAGRIAIELDGKTYNPDLAHSH